MEQIPWVSKRRAKIRKNKREKNKKKGERREWHPHLFDGVLEELGRVPQYVLLTRQENPHMPTPAEHLVQEIHQAVMCHGSPAVEEVIHVVQEEKNLRIEANRTRHESHVATQCALHLQSALRTRLGSRKTDAYVYNRIEYNTI